MVLHGASKKSTFCTPLAWLMITGRPSALEGRLVTACDGPRAYVGLASSYYETITQNYQRLNDNDWETALGKTSTKSPAWQASILGP